MKTKIELIKEDFGRDLYWTKIVFLSDDEKKQSYLFISATLEYLSSKYEKAITDDLKDCFDKLLEIVIKKWANLNDKLFDHDVHYDVYSNTDENESKGIDFLISKFNQNA